MVTARVARDRPGFGPCLLDDEIRLPPGLVLERDGRLLRGHERRSQQALELAEAHEIVLELFDLVREVGALAPDVFVAGGDLVEQVVDRRVSCNRR